MKTNNRTFIDLLKIDVEGAEFESLDEIIRSFALSGAALPFGQLQLEIHALNTPYSKFPKFLEWWESLEKAGLRPFWTETNLGHVNLDRSALPDIAEVSYYTIAGSFDAKSWSLVLFYQYQGTTCFDFGRLLN